jgi:predicted nucleic acid-binding protein
VRVVLDAGPVIHLSWLHRLDLLPALFEEVLIPEAVRDEVLAAPDGTLGLDDIRAALASGNLTVRALPTGARAAPVPSALGAGEAAAIALAVELGADLFLCDDVFARREATARGLTVTGTIGVLKAARERGLIDAVLPLVLELRRLGLWVSDALIDEVRTDEAMSARRRPGSTPPG